MERASSQALQQPRKSATPRTDLARFIITPMDVGSHAVRPGCMAGVEEERQVLLTAARLLLGRISAGNVEVGAVFEHMLVAAIKISEAGDLIDRAKS